MPVRSSGLENPLPLWQISVHFLLVTSVLLAVAEAEAVALTQGQVNPSLVGELPPEPEGSREIRARTQGAPEMPFCCESLNPSSPGSLPLRGLARWSRQAGVGGYASR